MQQAEINEKLRKGCEDALTAFHKLKLDEYAEIQSKLEFVIGSYNHDKNPVGLHEYAVRSLRVLKDVKEKNPRKVTKKVIEDLEKSITKYDDMNNHK